MLNAFQLAEFEMSPMIVSIYNIICTTLVSCLLVPEHDTRIKLVTSTFNMIDSPIEMTAERHNCRPPVVGLPIIVELYDWT